MRTQYNYTDLCDWICRLILFFFLITRFKYFMKLTENFQYQMNSASAQGLRCSQNCNFCYLMVQ